MRLLYARSDRTKFGYDDDNLLVSAGAMLLGPDAQHGLLRTTELGAIDTSQDYSPFGELSNFEAMHGATLLYREEILLRDALGRIEDRRETIGGVTTDYHYEYDAAGRLEQVFVNSALQTSYGYHPNGARTSKTSGAVTNGTYDNQDRIETWGALAFTHTANGERLTRTDTTTSQTTTYSYDALGNLLHVALPGGPAIDYVVDGLNRRIGKKVGGTLVQGFLYRDRLEPVAELDGSGALVSRFVYASRPHVPDYMVKGGQTYRILSDHLGSVRLVVNASTGAIAQRIDYDEFGVVTLDTNPGFQPFGFAGGLYDPDTQLVRFGARDYDPETGRWTAKDPIGFAGGDANLYGYVVNDPINLLDSDGRAAHIAVGAIIGGIIGGASAASAPNASTGSILTGTLLGAAVGVAGAASFGLGALDAGIIIGGGSGLVGNISGQVSGHLLAKGCLDGFEFNAASAFNAGAAGIAGGVAGAAFGVAGIGAATTTGLSSATAAWLEYHSNAMLSR